MVLNQGLKTRYNLPIEVFEDPCCVLAFYCKLTIFTLQANHFIVLLTPPRLVCVTILGRTYSLPHVVSFWSTCNIVYLFLVYCWKLSSAALLTAIWLDCIFLNCKSLLDKSMCQMNKWCKWSLPSPCVWNAPHK